MGETASKCITIEMSLADFVPVFSSEFFSPCCFVWEDESAERLDNACSCYCLKQSIYVFSVVIVSFELASTYYASGNIILLKSTLVSVNIKQQKIFKRTCLSSLLYFRISRTG